MSWKLHTAMCNVLEAAHIQDASRLGGLELQWQGREAKTKIDCSGNGCSFNINWKKDLQVAAFVGVSGRNSFLNDLFCCSVKSFIIKKVFCQNFIIHHK